MEGAPRSAQQTADTLNRRSIGYRYEEPAWKRWLALLFGHTFVRRALVALACSIALHEIVAALIPAFLPSDVQHEVVEHVTIARIQMAPTPSPTPRPTPKAPPHVVTVAKNNVTPTIAPVVPRPEGKAAHKEAIKREAAPRPKPPRVIHATPIWQTVPTGGQGAGAGAKSGAGSLGNGASGTGTGNQGSGAGGGGGPCGAVDFMSKGDATYNPDTGMYERDNVQAIVHYADGTAQTVDLDWTWRFKSRSDDPFNIHANAPMYFQFPPKAQRADEPPAVQYIMRYSSRAGHTLLNDTCPNIPAPPTPQP